MRKVYFLYNIVFAKITKTCLCFASKSVQAWVKTVRSCFARQKQKQKQTRSDRRCDADTLRMTVRRRVLVERKRAKF